MKAQAFLELVGKMMQTQQDYFQAKREGLVKARDILIASKALEKQVRVIVKEGHLEPDKPTARVMSFDEYVEQMEVAEADDKDELSRIDYLDCDGDEQ